MIAMLLVCLMITCEIRGVRFPSLKSQTGFSLLVILPTYISSSPMQERMKQSLRISKNMKLIKHDDYYQRTKFGGPSSQKIQIFHENFF